VRSLLISAILIVNSSYSFSQVKSDYCTLFQKTLNLYNENSFFSIKPEQFYFKAFQENFIQTLDPYLILYTSKDFELFNQTHKIIKDNYLASYCKIEDDLFINYTKNVDETIEILKKLKQEKLDFNKPDSVYLGFDSLHKTLYLDKEIRCRKYLKFLIIQDVLESSKKYDSLIKNREVLSNYIDAIKVKEINKIVKNLRYLLDSPEETQEKVFSAFINSFINQYDSYGQLFSNKAFNQFKEHLSTHSSNFGFLLETDKQGQIIIASVIPGSSAWKSGVINSGDRVLKIETEKGTSIHLENTPMSEIVEFLSNIDSEKLTITIKKNNNQIEIIDLYLEELDDPENSVQSFILHAEKKIGYIVLPAFYTSWEVQNNFGCAQDVGRAIYFLKKEKIDALIIDLRNNGGGSIIEAIDLVGIFVDFGTLSIEENKYHEFTSIKDFNRGTLYDGPLAILVNSNSASASEMTAAVLQDYNRAIIVGNPTYGKATGQTLSLIENNNNEVLKFTTNKYYRVTGKSYHHKGVIPDILLPDYLNKITNKEPTQPSDSTNSINKKFYYVPLEAIPKDRLNKYSNNRTLHHNKFNTIRVIDSIYTHILKDFSYFPLYFNGYLELLKKKELIISHVNNTMKTESDYFAIDLLQKDKDLALINKYYADLYKENFQSIMVDPYIEETLKILTDYIRIKSNNDE